MTGSILGDKAIVGKHGYMMQGDMQPFKMQNSYHN
jgi:hypothetical protein